MVEAVIVVMAVAVVVVVAVVEVVMEEVRGPLNTARALRCPFSRGDTPRGGASMV